MRTIICAVDGGRSTCTGGGALPPIVVPVAWTPGELVTPLAWTPGELVPPVAWTPGELVPPVAWTPGRATRGAARCWSGAGWSSVGEKRYRVLVIVAECVPLDHHQKEPSNDNTQADPSKPTKTTRNNTRNAQTHAVPTPPRRTRTKCHPRAPARDERDRSSGEQSQETVGFKSCCHPSRFAVGTR